MGKALFNLAGAARLIGCDRATTARQAKRLGLGQRVGSQVILTASEVEKLRKSITPRPRR